MNIVVWLLEVDSIGLVEIQDKHGAKSSMLANLQCGKNFSLNNKTIGEDGGETFQSRMQLLEP
jgi:hypothetical protein